jgi:hypothetical protein
MHFTRGKYPMGVLVMAQLNLHFHYGSPNSKGPIYQNDVKGSLPIALVGDNAKCSSSCQAL